MRRISNLLPFLHISPHPRVLSVLNKDIEKFIIGEDLALEHNWSLNLMKHRTRMTSLKFDYLVANNKTVTFIHNVPGFGESDNHRRINSPWAVSLPHRIFYTFVNQLFGIFCHITGMAPTEAGNEHRLTSSTPNPSAWCVHWSSESLPRPKALEHYEENDWLKKIWTFTVNTARKAIG